MSVTLLGLVCFGTVILMFGLGLVAAIKMIGGSVVRMARDDSPDPGWWRAVAITIGLFMLAGLIFGSSWHYSRVPEATPAVAVPRSPADTMSHVPYPSAAPQVAMSPVGVLVVVLVTTFSVVWAIARPHAPAGSLTPSPRNGYWAGSALALMLLAGGCTLLFGLMFMRFSASPTTHVAVPVTEDQWPVLAAAPRTAATQSLTDQDVLLVSMDQPASAVSPVNVAAAAAPPLPEWVRAGTTVEDGAQLRVLFSGQYATEQEARADVDAQTQALLNQDLARYSHLWLGMRQSSLGSSSIPAAVRQQHVQVERRQFTSFSAPMYRVWYQIELSPRVREASLVRIKALQLEGRTLTVAAGFGALLLLPLAILLAGAISRALGGLAYEFTLGAALTSVLLVWGAGVWLLNQYVVLWG